MKKIIFVIFLSIIWIFVFFWINKNKANCIFDVYQEKKINIWNNLNLTWKDFNYKNINYSQKIWKWFFINKKWFFLIPKHLYDKKNDYYILINNKKYKFDIIKIYKNKDIILAKLKKEINNSYCELANKIRNSKVYILKNNKKYFFEIHKNNNLLQANIRLKPWDSGTAIFDLDWKIIWFFVMTNSQKKVSFAENLTQK